MMSGGCICFLSDWGLPQRARRVFCVGLGLPQRHRGHGGFALFCSRLRSGLKVYRRGAEGAEGLLRCARNDGVGWVGLPQRHRGHGGFFVWVWVYRRGAEGAEGFLFFFKKNRPGNFLGRFQSNYK